MNQTKSFDVLDPETVSPRIGSAYPAPFSEPCAARTKHGLGDALGLSQFGVNLVELPPGVWSAQRHWHRREDEFVMVLEGEITLISDEGELVLKPGQVTGFPAGVENGHHLVNRSDAPARYLEVGTRSAAEQVDYPDIDMKMDRKAGGKSAFLNKAGDPL